MVCFEFASILRQSETSEKLCSQSISCSEVNSLTDYTDLAENEPEGVER